MPAYGKLENEPTVPVDVVLGEFDGLAQDRLGQVELFLLLVQVGQHAGRFEFNVVE